MNDPRIGSLFTGTGALDMAARAIFGGATACRVNGSDYVCSKCAAPAPARELVRVRGVVSDEHECVDCRALPVRPSGQLADPAGVDYRPAIPRKIDERSRSGTYGGPRSLRCATHYRAHRDARRQAASDARSRKRAGVDEATRRDVLAEQGGRCPCGAGLGGKRLNLSADHDHDLARDHDHPEDVACIECLVGFLCHHCNREVVGFLARAGRRGNVSRTRGEAADALVSVAEYLRNPPAARVRERRRRKEAA